jgi:hypothetical protein
MHHIHLNIIFHVEHCHHHFFLNMYECSNPVTGVRTTDLTIILCFSVRVKGVVLISALFS